MANLPYFHPIPGTGIALDTDENGSLVAYYQMIPGQVDQATQQSDGSWKVSTLPVKPVSASPLAVIGGEVIQLYYLDQNYVVQNYLWDQQQGWHEGDVSTLNAKAAPGSGLAAIQYGPMLGSPAVKIRVYYQDSESLSIKELASTGGNWGIGSLDLPGAIGGTSIAAVTYYAQRQEEIHIYYQAEDLNLKEHHYNNSGWSPGTFAPGVAAAQTPINAIIFGSAEIQVFWRDLIGQAIYSTYTKSWSKPVTIKIVAFGYKFAVIQTDNGQQLRILNQLSSGAVVEYLSNDGGNSWATGQNVA